MCARPTIVLNYLSACAKTQSKENGTPYMRKDQERIPNYHFLPLRIYQLMEGW